MDNEIKNLIKNENILHQKNIEIKIFCINILCILNSHNLSDGKISKYNK